MAHREPAPAGARSPDSIADSAKLRAMLGAALAARPVDLTALRGAVSTYVNGVRDAGVSPMYAISVLRRVVEDARLTPPEQSQMVVRHMVVWCVEGYLGHPGDDAAPTEPR